jgi:hypothetical protein
VDIAKLRMKVPSSSRQIAALALSLAACAANSVPGGGEDRDPQPQSDQRIVPKERIGLVRLGMSVNDVFQMLGRPQSNGAVYPDGFFLRYGCLEITFASEESVRHLSVECAQYKTAEGLGVGASASEVARAYGPLPEKNAYEDRNIQFVQCGRTNRICEVAIWLRY